ncbi:MAG: hypothetical protein F6K39_01010 [Okeania sp. SIO3B3]|nr:hypothetical protein [Okeania sp. SIO3B3]
MHATSLPYSPSNYTDATGFDITGLGWIINPVIEAVLEIYSSEEAIPIMTRSLSL